MFKFLFGCQSDKTFLSDIDFSDGDYALFINHKEHGKSLIDDETILKKYNDKIKIKTSFINYLPGEGNRTFGLILFKNKKNVKAKLAGKFKYFEIDDVLQYAKPVEEKRFDGNKSAIQTQLEKLRTQGGIYYPHIPKFDEKNQEFLFFVHLPSIAVHVQYTEDSTDQVHEKHLIDEKKWEEKIKTRIKILAGDITDFDISVYKSGTVNNFPLIDATKKSNDILKDNYNKPIRIKDYVLYDFDITIKASKEIAEKLYTLDYSSCLKKEEQNMHSLEKRIKELIAESNSPQLNLDNGDVGVEYIKDIWTQGKLIEQTYSLFWLELSK